MSRVVSIHGIHDDGDKGVDLLAAEFAAHVGLPHYAPQLPHRWAFGDYTNFGLISDAASISAYLTPTSIVITHSRGALALNEALRRFNQTIKTAFLFAPALPADDDGLTTAHRMKNGYVIFNENDRALKWSRWLPWHPYADFFGGSLGRDGYKGTAKNIHNVPAHQDVSFLDHSEFWGTADARASWIEYMADKSD